MVCVQKISRHDRKALQLGIRVSVAKWESCISVVSLPRRTLYRLG